MASSKYQATSSIQHNHELNGENDSTALLPHLETFDKMLKLPVVEAAWHQGQDVYGRVKGEKIVFFVTGLFSTYIYIFLNIHRVRRIRKLIRQLLATLTRTHFGTNHVLAEPLFRLIFPVIFMKYAFLEHSKVKKSSTITIS